MAEAIGIAAAAATLSKIISRSVTIIRQCRDTSREMSDLSQELAQLAVELEILCEVQAASLVPQNTVSTQIWTLQKSSISLAQARATALQKSLKSIELRSKGLRGKARWLVVGREESSKLLQNLLQIRTGLTTAMTMSSRLLQLAFHAEEMRAIQDLDQKSVKLLKNNMVVGYDPSKALPITNTTLGTSLVESELFQSSENSQRSLDLPFIGPLLCTTTTVTHHSGIITYVISLMLRLPFARVLIADILLRRWMFSWCNFRVLRNSTLAVVKLVDEDSEFMKACRRADLRTMRRMLQNNEATPNEITLGNRTPMWEAIESDQIEAVKVLLHYGADVNGFLGRRRMSPLVIGVRRRNVEMVRFLLAQGACDQHVTALGWTPLFYLWTELSSRLQREPADAVLEVIATRPGFALSHSNLIDTRGYGCVQMAAIRGTAADIHGLLRRGVDPFLATGPEQWQAVHFAVEHGNLQTFEALLSYYPDDGCHVIDAQGWTFLHISAITGHGHITERLLELGIDQDALTHSHIECAPDDLEYLEEQIRGRRWTALQLAALHSVQREVIFLKAVCKVAGPSAVMDAHNSDIEDDTKEWHDTALYVSPSN